MKGLSRFLSIFENFYKVLECYERKEEFEDIIGFFSYISQIFNNYMTNYIEGKKVNLDKIKLISNSLAYNYYIIGGGFGFLTLGKNFEEEEEYEYLEIPIPIRNTVDWYNCFKNLNSHNINIIN